MLSAAGAPQDAVRMLASAPLSFEPASNGGPASFVARGLRFRFSFARDSAVLQAGEQTVSLKFEGAAPGAKIGGLNRLRSTTSIIQGNDPARWRTALPNYGRLRVRELYRGIDLVYYGSGNELEYDLVVKPAADPARLRLRFSGSDAHIDRDGNLVAAFLQKRPTAYQVAASGVHVPVASRYRKNSDGTFGFVLGSYDKQREVIIDPVLTFSTYIAGSQQDFGTAIGHDSTGYIYVAGTTQSQDLSMNGDTAVNFIGGSSIFVVKIDPNVPPEHQRVFLSYFGGSGDETLNDMAVTPSGIVYLTGSTSSSDFPTVNAAQSTLSGTSDAFVMRLDLTQDQPVNYSTYLGGSSDDLGSGIAVDAKGRIFVAGTTRSNDFPVTGGFQSVNGSTQTAFVAALDPSQSGSGTFIYSSYVGGAGGEAGRGIAAASDGTMWVVGSTYSADFPIKNRPFQDTYHPGGDAFVAQVSPNLQGGDSLLYASYLGGNGPDEAKRIVVDPAGRIIIAGYTGSTDFPVTSNAVQANYGGNFDAFVTILTPQNSSQLVYSTYWGGSDADIPFDLKLDPSGNLYLSGFTISKNLFFLNALQPLFDVVTLDGLALKFNPVRPSLGAIGYSSYVSSTGRQIAYGIDFDLNGKIYLTGYTTGPLFDSFGGAVKPTPSGNTDAFVMGINACSYTLSPTSQQFPTQGGPLTINLTPATPDCAWTASSPVDWITVSPASGTGAGSVRITVLPNTTGAFRTATISIAGIGFTVTQQA